MNIEICEKDNIVSVVQNVKNKEGRLICINGYINDEGNNVIVYTFNVSGNEYSYKIIDEDEIPSIRKIYLCAAQFEDEIQEIMPIIFLGSDIKQRVFLPEQFEIGRGQILIMSLDELRILKNN